MRFVGERRAFEAVRRCATSTVFAAFIDARRNCFAPLQQSLASRDRRGCTVCSETGGLAPSNNGATSVPCRPRVETIQAIAANAVTAIAHPAGPPLLRPRSTHDRDAAVSLLVAPVETLRAGSVRSAVGVLAHHAPDHDDRCQSQQHRYPTEHEQKSIRHYGASVLALRWNFDVNRFSRRGKLQAGGYLRQHLRPAR